MTTLSELRAMQPETLGAAGSAVGTGNQTFDDAMRNVSRHVDSGLAHWEGNAATAALARLLSDRITGSHVSAAVRAQVEALNEASASLASARDAALSIADEAIAENFTVSDDGHVSAPAFQSGNTIADLLFQAQLDERAKAFEARLIPALVTFEEQDTKAGAAIDTATNQLEGLQQDPTGGPMSQPVMDILDGNAFLPDDPIALAEFWSTLSPADKNALAAWDPAIGNRDGLPAEDKDHYGHEYAATLQDKAQSELAALDRQHPDWANGQNVPLYTGTLDKGMQQQQREYGQWANQRETLQTQISGYQEIQEQASEPGRYLLNVDDGGRAAIAINNPDTAENVATFVPGTDSNVTDMAGDMDRSERMLEQARRADPDASTSVVTWYGYNAPQSVLPEAAMDSFAEAGAPRLESFQDGLRAAHDGPSPAHNTVVGHSYGTTTIGEAASGGRSLNADDLVFLGSPGVNQGSVFDLHLDGVDNAHNGSHIYATAAATDPVPYIGDLFGDLAHGVNPVREGFGATVFDSDPGDPIRIPLLGGEIPINPSTHSDYWLPDSPSLITVGSIIAGKGVS